MKPLALLTIIILFSQSCRPRENKKLAYHNLKQPLSSFFSKKDTLFRRFYNKEFLQTLDTMKFEGKSLPSKISLLEYYGASFHSVTHLKLLFSSYPKMSRIYLFRYEDKNWKLKWCITTSSKDLDSIQLAIKNSINEDKRRLLRDSLAYRVGDLARFSVKKKISDTNNIARITLNKPGDILLNTLMDIKRK